MKLKNKQTKTYIVLFKLKALGWEQKKLEVYFDFSAKESCSFPDLIQANLANIYWVCSGEAFVSRVAERWRDTTLSS